jgi:hypothetical protein
MKTLSTKRHLATLLLTLGSACTLNVGDGRTGSRATAYGCPLDHAHPAHACEAMLADAFPDTAPEHWTILECGDMGVLASVSDGNSGVQTFAVTPDGSVWGVTDGCAWALLASP